MQVGGNFEAAGPLEASRNLDPIGGAVLKDIGDADGSKQFEANSRESVSVSITRP